MAANTANITPEIPGRVLQWNVAVGSTVKAGQVIGQIDTSTVAQSSAANAGALSQTAPLTASRSLIRAPISGQVIQSNTLVGQLVNTGQNLAVIADDSSAYISANIDEADIGKVKLGQPVSVTLDALTGPDPDRAGAADRAGHRWHVFAAALRRGRYRKLHQSLAGDSGIDLSVGS